ncbi:MAG: ribulose-phosphate 3-epimerase [Bacilli bacterium]|jgi:ribulose-phosphate 3-epimerase|nr:ribulose-phosphate 3-epimerase [Clostridium sp.]MDY3798768.1 ribulose-phosphate 3-epimerase [Bacilli bacterium]
MIKVSTSILTCNNRIQATEELNKTNTDYIHIDYMDGIFVDNKEFTIEEIKTLSKISTKKLDIHIMAENPEPIIQELKGLNIEYITIHYEINKPLNKIINLIHNQGYKCGISIKPKTNPKNIIEYLKKIDLVLIMSVEPGKGGQKFIPDVLNKIKELKQNNLIIEIDGGINDTNIEELKNIVDIVVVGSYITNSSDYNKQINNLKN